jgi:hypothetical protein
VCLSDRPCCGPNIQRFRGFYPPEVGHQPNVDTVGHPQGITCTEAVKAFNHVQNNSIDRSAEVFGLYELLLSQLIVRSIQGFLIMHLFLQCMPAMGLSTPVQST